MKIFVFFYSKKVIFHQNKKNSTIAQQGGGLATLITRDDNEGFRMRRPHPDPVRLFFSILKFVPFKKLNGAGRDGLAWMRKFSNPPRLHLIFVFIFYFNLYIYIYIYIYYIKIKNFNPNTLKTPLQLNQTHHIKGGVGREPEIISPLSSLLTTQC